MLFAALHYPCAPRSILQNSNNKTENAFNYTAVIVAKLFCYNNENILVRH